MGTLKQPSQGFEQGNIRANFAIGPSKDDPAPVALATAQDVITGLKPGDSVQVYANDFFHAIFTTGSNPATTSKPGPFAPGVYRWVCPDGCDKVSMIQASGATATGGAFKG